MALVLLLLPAACTSSETDHRVTVLAAASLTAVFDELGDAFVAAEPSRAVVFSFGASSALAAQVRAGAPADVLATADPSTMEQLSRSGLVGEPRTFARNRLAILVPAGNPEGISSLADLARPDLTVVVCAPQVPCGRLAREALDRAGVTLVPRSLERDVRAVVTRVVLGEADAGIVYHTDVAATAGRADGVEIAASFNVEARFPIAVVRAGDDPSAADAFVEFVLSPRGQAILSRAGFGAP